MSVEIKEAAIPIAPVNLREVEQKKEDLEREVVSVNLGEVEQEVKKEEPVVEEKVDEVKPETYKGNLDEKIKKQYDVTSDDIKMAQQRLKELTNKKIRGEL